jgi:hypothetical protein
MRILLLTPPLTQLNTPYPATANLTAFLRARGYAVSQADLGIDWVLRLFTRSSLERLHAALDSDSKAESVRHFLDHSDEILLHVDAVVAFLQGRDESMARSYAAGVLVKGPRSRYAPPIGKGEVFVDWALGSMGVVDRARHFATQFIADVADMIREGIDPDFAFIKYGHTIVLGAPNLDPLLEAVERTPPTLETLWQVTDALYEREQPDVVGMSIPFSGNVLGALRVAQRMRMLANAAGRRLSIVWGGGFINTDLRKIQDERLFDFVDAVTYDDGEQPLLHLLEHLAGERERHTLVRTRLRDGYFSDERAAPLDFAKLPAPTYSGLPLSDYFSMVENVNPMHRLWSDGHWNKLTMAHGCYWKKCTFCDVSLDYIGNYRPREAARLADQMEQMIAETNCRGFHFVDEAAPPALMVALAEEIVRRKLAVTWWGNIRFENAFTRERCRLLAEAGCIAVTGGLEVASDRLLALIKKGVTVAQVARVTKAFVDAGIMVHAYLMYGFPTQTESETIDSLEMVRQLFAAGCLDSAFWHLFSLTTHSPIARDPKAYGIRIEPMLDAPFAQSTLYFQDPTGCDHERLGPGLKNAVRYYILGLGHDEDVRKWFAHSVPKPTVPKTFIRRALAEARSR